MAVLCTEQWSQECPRPDPCHLRLWDHVAYERRFASGLCCWCDLLVNRHNQWKKDLFRSQVQRVHCILTWSQELEQRNIPTVETLGREELTSWTSKKQTVWPEQEIAEEPRDPAPKDSVPPARSYLWSFHSLPQCHYLRSAHSTHKPVPGATSAVNHGTSCTKCNHRYFKNKRREQTPDSKEAWRSVKGQRRFRIRRLNPFFLP